jgi:hypothetical protein
VIIQTLTPEGRDRSRSPSGPAVGTAERLWQRDRLVVMARSTTEVVERAGGWVADRVLIGVEAVVLTIQPPDHRALRVLGATGHELRPALSASSRILPAQEIAVHAQLYHSSEPRLRELVDHAIACWGTGLRLWDDVPHTPVEPLIRHDLSIAARAFKAHALRIARAEDDLPDVGATESFGSATRRNR